MPGAALSFVFGSVSGYLQEVYLGLLCAFVSFIMLGSFWPGICVLVVRPVIGTLAG